MQVHIFFYLYYQTSTYEMSEANLPFKGSGKEGDRPTAETGLDSLECVCKQGCPLVGPMINKRMHFNTSK